MEISTEKKLKSPRRKLGKVTLPPLKNIPVMPCMVGRWRYLLPLWNILAIKVKYLMHLQLCMNLKLSPVEIWILCINLLHPISRFRCQILTLNMGEGSGQNLLQIEGLHDAVRTYAHTIFQNLLASFCTARMEKNNKKC